MSDFNRLKKIWKVRTAFAYESLGHLIRIDGDSGEGQATVTCLEGDHRYGNGTFLENPDRIDGDSYTITLEEGTPNVIVCKFKGPVGGSWTADDNYPQEG
jgi:hypothetical protein